MTSAYYTLRVEDVGAKYIRCFDNLWLVSGSIGQVLPCDVGKRVYYVTGILQVENDEQFQNRTMPGDSPSKNKGDSHA